MDAESNHPRATGVLLAAGNGSRLGLGPKALLRKANGDTLLESALGALLDGGCAHVLVVLGAEAEHVAQNLEPDEHFTVLVNDAWARGMGSSFALGMEAVPQGSSALVALVDQPGLAAKAVRRILEAHRPGRITAAGYRRGGTSMRRGHPVLFAPEHTALAASAATSDAGARAYLAAHPDMIDLVDCSDVDSGLDIDTVADLHLLGGGN